MRIVLSNRDLTRKCHQYNDIIDLMFDEDVRNFINYGLHGEIWFNGHPFLHRCEIYIDLLSIYYRSKRWII